MLIYKILRAGEWAELDQLGETPGAPVDIADGFVHFSGPDTVRETAARHFAGEDDLVLAAFDPALFGPTLRWEVSRGGAEFPHLYGPLRRADVLWVVPLPIIDGAHRFPDDL